MERNERDNRTPRVSLILRICCGGYLLYLGWQLRPAAFQGEQGVWFGLAMIAFILIGAALCFFSARSFLRGDYQGAPVDAPEEPEPQDGKDAED